MTNFSWRKSAKECRRVNGNFRQVVKSDFNEKYRYTAGKCAENTWKLFRRQDPLNLNRSVEMSNYASDWNRTPGLPRTKQRHNPLRPEPLVGRGIAGVQLHIASVREGTLWPLKDNMLSKLPNCFQIPELHSYRFHKKVIHHYSVYSRTRLQHQRKFHLGVNMRL